MSVTRWTEHELEAAHAGRLHRVAPSRRVPAGAVVALVVLAVGLVASWWYVLGPAPEGTGLFSGEAARRAGAFARRLVGIGTGAPVAYGDLEAWRRVAALAGETLAMSVLGAGLAALGALATIPFAARTLTHGRLASRHPAAGWSIFLVTRGTHTVGRAVPDLVWALLVAFVFGPGLLSGAVALGLHNYGVMGRLGADVVEDIDPEPIRSLRASGAGDLQVLLYGVLPQVLPQFLTFLLYRWEVIIRATAVVGFAANVGLGYELLRRVRLFDFTQVGLVILVYIILVLTVDVVSVGLRRLAR